MTIINAQTRFIQPQERKESTQGEIEEAMTALLRRRLLRLQDDDKPPENAA